ncbi:MAG: YbaK/EbsC family protein [Ignavibacteria bacterium]|jgi:prolyl-tRNA editing enzyme YbaK/EbsC (Cys-tRNA(Pro) deacylase)/ubiquinone/menaquinone biosynthesis C-methylase UbiE
MESWQKYKDEHLKLSAVAADKYDELYEKANFATGSYMRYELERIKKYLSFVPSKDIALDLGCGTGRDSFYMCKHFEQVYGYDFSSQMILVANKNKIQKRIGNVYFEPRDVEEQELPWENNSISFVNTAFGMGSFVQNLENLFREIRRVLKPSGIVIFSFYNSDALVNKLVLQWRPALAARVVAGEDCLEVNFKGNSYKIAAKAYTVNEIKKKTLGAFGPTNPIDITTFPTLSALFPQELFANATTRELCTNVDTLLANNLEIAAGPYIVAVCKKGGKFDKIEKLKGYEQVLNLLRTHNIDTIVRIKEHSPVRNMEDVKKVLDCDPSFMIKSILVTVDNPENNQETKSINRNLFLIGIPADRKLDFSKLATILDVPRHSLKMATQLQLEEITGFKVGSIPPFGLPKNIHVIIDIRIQEKDEIWCGTGKSTESIRLFLHELKILSTPTFNDISKPI